MDTILEMRQSPASNIQELHAFGYSILKNIKGEVRLGQPHLNTVIMQMKV